MLVGSLESHSLKVGLKKPALDPLLFPCLSLEKLPPSLYGGYELFGISREKTLLYTTFSYTGLNKCCQHFSGDPGLSHSTHFHLASASTSSPPCLPNPSKWRSHVRSALSDTPNQKASPATPRVNKPSRGIAKSEVDSPSPLQSSRLSVDRSPRSVPSKPTLDRRSPRLTTPPEDNIRVKDGLYLRSEIFMKSILLKNYDMHLFEHSEILKKTTRILKPSELQAELNLAQEDLRKAKEKLVLVEKEKAQALDELKEAQRLTEEANEKLREALMAQKRAEEDSEIEKFRTVEMEQAGIEAVQRKEDHWQEELIAVRNQHALDVAALLSATQELQKAKQELAMTSDAKNQALSHADDATKIAEIHAEKVEILSAELIRLKSTLDSRLEMEANENNKLVEELKSEIEFQRLELEKTRGYEERLSQNEATLEQLNVDLEAAKIAESYARNLLEERQTRVEELEVQMDEAKHLERTASESLETVMKQLERSNDSLHIAESEISSLKEKIPMKPKTLDEVDRGIEI
ncbi:WEB family protein At4g27595, chloroplastic-like [Olea europaea var. sylvestris]|uniref:WEB family protein At4g27595, chloroplastic-like n=1 Tax=Olea europaea var. sylvestris TaxID=158386 RepID=UPI000C1D1E2F|nr:WEB family protein At4g27595, chloroplastic-like [Olea europaea var. sylvestris]